MSPSRTRTGARGRFAPKIRVLIADDHLAFAEALRVAIALRGGISVVGTATDGDQAVELARTKRPHVVLMDVAMPSRDGIEATRRIKEVTPEARVIMLSALDDDRVVAEALDAGAAGFLSKVDSIRDVARTIKAAYKGEFLVPPDEVRRIVTRLHRLRAADAADRARVQRLTPRETEILQLMADGCGPDAIAEMLEISPNTLRTHVQNILFKLKVHSKLEALIAAIRAGTVRTGQRT